MIHSSQRHWVSQNSSKGLPSIAWVRVTTPAPSRNDAWASPWYRCVCGGVCHAKGALVRVVSKARNVRSGWFCLAVDRPNSGGVPCGRCRRCFPNSVTMFSRSMDLFVDSCDVVIPMLYKIILKLLLISQTKMDPGGKAVSGGRGGGLVAVVRVCLCVFWFARSLRFASVRFGFFF